MPRYKQTTTAIVLIHANLKREHRRVEMGNKPWPYLYTILNRTGRPETKRFEHDESRGGVTYIETEIVNS